MKLGIVVGLIAEARIGRPLGRVAAGGGTAIGAERAARQAIADGAAALLSFGLAGGLDPQLLPGMLVIPTRVLAEEGQFSADPAMLDALGGPTVDSIASASEVMETVAAKRRLYEYTGAAAVDLESGAVAAVAHQHGVPFAVLRVVCDPAGRVLPPAALLALDQAGAIRALNVLASIAVAPAQVPALFALARDAAIARRALIRRVAELRDRLAGM